MLGVKGLFEMLDEKNKEYVMNYELKENEYYMVTLVSGIKFCVDIDKIKKLKNFISIDIYRGELNSTHKYL